MNSFEQLNVQNNLHTNTRNTSLRLVKTGVLALLFTAFIQCQRTTPCTSFLACLDQTVWVSKNQQIYWQIYNNPNGVYMDVHTLNGNCLDYETSTAVGAEIRYQTPTNLVELYDGKEWIYTIVNDTVIEKNRTTGGSTIYLFKSTPKALILIKDNFEFCP